MVQRAVIGRRWPQEILGNASRLSASGAAAVDCGDHRFNHRPSRRRAPSPRPYGAAAFCGMDADRHGAGVESHGREGSTPATARGSTVRHGQPSDPRRGILPRGGAGWPERGDQEDKAPGSLAFRTGPNNASVLSRLMARGTLAGPADRLTPHDPGAHRRTDRRGDGPRGSGTVDREARAGSQRRRGFGSGEGVTKGRRPPDARIATAPVPGGIGQTRPRPGLAGSTVQQETPSDPRPGILSLHCAGWPARGAHVR